MTVSFLVSFTNIANIHLLIHILLKYHIINLRWCYDFLITLVENFSNEKKLLNIALGEVSYLRTYYDRVIIFCLNDQAYNCLIHLLDNWDGR